MKKLLPDYVPFIKHGEVCYEGPLTIQDVTAYCFGIQADRNALQALVDSQLNSASQGAVQYQVFGNWVSLIFQNCGSATSASQQVGYLPDREAAFVIPVIQKMNNNSQPDRLLFWIPYLLIDVTIGMVMGREIWGYPKALATVELPTSAADPLEFTATTTLFKKFAPTTKGVDEQLLRVSADGLRGDLKPTWNTVEDAAQNAIDALGSIHSDSEGAGGAVLRELLRVLLSRQVTFVNLKQLRDVSNSSKACYQALTLSPIKLSSFKGMGFLPGDFELQITRCESHQVLKDLGLTVKSSDSNSDTVAIQFGFWVKTSFETENGEVVWEA